MDEALLVVDAGLDHAVTDCLNDTAALDSAHRGRSEPRVMDPLPGYLGDDELCVLRAVELQLLSDVGQGDPRVRQADHPNT